MTPRDPEGWRPDVQAPACDEAQGMHRRTALSLMSGGVIAAASAWPGQGAAAASRPLLATPEQAEAETTLLALVDDPELKRIQRELKAELLAMPRGKLPDAAPTVENAIAQWTNSLLFAEITSYRARPAILWGTDDTPRVWLGHTLAGVGTSGDNPDAVYRSCLIKGEGRYEIVGRYDPDKRATQLVFEVDRGDLARPAEMMVRNPNGTDLGVQIALLMDEDLPAGPDGTFRITLGPGAGGPNHIATPPGPVTFGLRDILADWTQRPCQVSVRRLDGDEPDPFDPAELRRRARADLPDYVRFWCRFPDHFAGGGLQPNQVTAPSARAGGWGALSGVRFALAPDEAMVITTTKGAARYTGFQVVDPWLIAPDARRHQCSLNLSQVAPNPDGSFTYVISPQDPGVANWLDTAGLHNGYGIIRWQAFPRGGIDTSGLMREHRVVKLAEVEKMPGLPRVTPEQRKTAIEHRAWTYAARTR